MIAYETNLYAIQSGKENLSVSVGEIKQFFAINMMMTYIKYPAVCIGHQLLVYGSRRSQMQCH